MKSIKLVEGLHKHPQDEEPSVLKGQKHVDKKIIILSLSLLLIRGQFFKQTKNMSYSNATHLKAVHSGKSLKWGGGGGRDSSYAISWLCCVPCNKVD